MNLILGLREPVWDLVVMECVGSVGGGRICCS